MIESVLAQQNVKKQYKNYCLADGSNKDTRDILILRRISKILWNVRENLAVYKREAFPRFSWEPRCFLGGPRRFPGRHVRSSSRLVLWKWWFRLQCPTFTSTLVCILAWSNWIRAASRSFSNARIAYSASRTISASWRSIEDSTKSLRNSMSRICCRSRVFRMSSASCSTWFRYWAAFWTVSCSCCWARASTLAR